MTKLSYFFQTFEEAERHHWDSLECEWEREKQKILTALIDTAGENLDYTQEQVNAEFQFYDIR